MLITIGTTVYDGSKNEYEVVEGIGQGAFGYVYKIREKKNGTFYALKTLPALFSDQDTVNAFKHEGQLAVEINHPNVINYHFFHTGNEYPNLPPYIIMEYAAEGTLETLLQESRQKGEFFPNDTIVRMFEQLVSGMEAVNAKLIHRDIKPDNIVISGEQLKITDFGLAKVVQEATRTSTFKGLGCLRCLAPEGWKSERNTIQMDIYSMGLVFYEIATLKYPYVVAGSDVHVWSEAHLFQPVARPETINPLLTPALSQIIMQMLEKRTQERFATWELIKSLLSSTTVAPSEPEDSALIEQAVRKRLAADAVQKEQQLQQEREEQERKSLIRLIDSQFKQAILEPIKSFTEKLNSEYRGEQIVFDAAFMRGNFTFPSGKRVEIAVEPTASEGISRIIKSPPVLRGQKILAWGSLLGSDGRGINLLLVEQPGAVYGDWMMLLNKSGFFANQRRRPEPFAFALDELANEIRNVGVLGAHSIETKLLDIAFLKQFIADYF